MIGKSLPRYKITKKIGEGGMGVVYQAEDIRLKRPVALKFLTPELTRDPEACERFIQEAQAASALDHPNICTIHEIDETEDGQTFMCMSYYEGSTLKNLIAGRRMKVEQVINIANQIAAGLSKAHESGIIHRDIKPANIFITNDGLAKILDFGLAKLAEQTDVTRTGSTLGTIAYMAPEQIQGEDFDRRADIWSLGVVLYEMLTGSLPFKGDHERAITYSILSDDLEPASTIRNDHPPDLDRIIEKTLRKFPFQRYQHVDEIPVDLNMLDYSPESVTRERVQSTDPAVARIAQRSIKQTLAAAVSVTILVTIALTSIILLKSGGLPVDWYQRALPLKTGGIGEGQNTIAISPDGTHLAYIAEEDNTSFLYLSEISLQGHSTPVKVEGSMGALYPFFSRDSRSVGYCASGRFIIVELEGLVSRAFSSIDAIQQGISWDEDDSIVFADGQNGLFRIYPDGEPILLCEPGVEEIGYYWPEILPDGKGVIFTIYSSGRIAEAELAVMSFKTGEIHRLGINGTCPRYSRSGHLIYGEYQESGFGRLMTVSFNLRRLEVTDSPVSLGDRQITISARGEAGFDISDHDAEHNALVYFINPSLTSQRSLVWVDRADRMDRFSRTRRMYSNPAISPDGQMVAYGIDNDIWYQSLTSEAISWQLTFTGSNYEPVWRPPYHSELTICSDIAGQYNLYTLSLDGDLKLLLPMESPEEQFPASWSSDGRYLAYYERITNGNRNIYIYDSQTEIIHPFATSEHNEREPMFSNDGKLVAFVSDSTGQDEIYIKSFQPLVDTQHQVSQGGGTEPFWWPPSSYRNDIGLYFRNGDRMIAVEIIPTSNGVRVDTPIPLFPDNYITSTYRSEYSIHPSTELWLMVLEENVDDVNLITIIHNWEKMIK